MKIEVEVDEDVLAKQWLKDIVKMSKSDWEYNEDQEFWDEMQVLCKALLKLNWHED